MDKLTAARIMMDGGSGGNIGPKPTIITRNGIYNASDDNLDGYSKVQVNVGQTMCEKINNYATLLEDIFVDNYTFKIKYAPRDCTTPINWGAYTWGPQNQYYVCYPLALQTAIDFYFCIYDGNTMIEAVRIPADYYNSTAQYWLYNRTEYWYSPDVIFILPDDEYFLNNITHGAWRLYNDSSWSSDKVYYNFEMSVTFNQTYVEHNYTWVKTPPDYPEYEDNPTSSPYTYSTTLSGYRFPVVNSVDISWVYTDLTPEVFDQKINDISLKIYNAFNP